MPGLELGSMSEGPWGGTTGGARRAAETFFFFFGLFFFWVFLVYLFIFLNFYFFFLDCFLIFLNFLVNQNGELTFLFGLFLLDFSLCSFFGGVFVLWVLFVFDVGF